MSPRSWTRAAPHHRTVVVAALCLTIWPLAACSPNDTPPRTDHPAGADMEGATAQDGFWAHLGALCESAAEGRLLRAPEGDTQIDPDARLVVHFRDCGEREHRFPLHVDENRSRTWVFIRHDDALELRHDHRHPDGTEEDNSWYGALTVHGGTVSQQEFVTDRDGMMVGWRVEMVPGDRFTYGTIRDGEWRHHLEFDLTEPVEAPPPAWGFDGS
jgi:hypothetical protein